MSANLRMRTHQNKRKKLLRRLKSFHPLQHQTATEPGRAFRVVEQINISIVTGNPVFAHAPSEWRKREPVDLRLRQNDAGGYFIS